MKQNDMYNLVLGAAVVMIAYMALKQKGTKKPAVGTGPATTDWAEEWLSTITYS